MRRFPHYRAGIVLSIVMFLCSAVAAWAQQDDYRDSEEIRGQVWKLEFTICSDGQESFSIRLPYPNYTYDGEWADYKTDEIEAWAVGDTGPILYQLFHYNEGYSNEGVWMQITFPDYYNTITISVKQDAKITLPGLQYPLTFFMNNPWMYGTEIIDVNSPVISDVLTEALALAGDWHSGNRSVPEKIVNWMNLNMTWGYTPTAYPKTASTVLTERYGDCDEWAHAACALLIKAGIAAKVVLTGTIPTNNSTPNYFDDANLHLSVAYWDGYGWILIDPGGSSGFAILNRVILGADQDLRDIEFKFDPDFLKYYVSDKSFSYEEGYYSGGLSWHGMRNNACNKIILEHDEATSIPSQGSEPVNNVIPNIVTDAQYSERFPSIPRIENYPNPFNPVTNFNIDISSPGIASIDIYSVDGRFVTNVFSGYVEKGRKQVIWKCSGIQSGVYFARLQSPEGSSFCKVIILR